LLNHAPDRVSHASTEEELRRRPSSRTPLSPQDKIDHADHAFEFVVLPCSPSSTPSSTRSPRTPPPFTTELPSPEKPAGTQADGKIFPSPLSVVRSEI
jgi:hypothetical protein